MIFLQNTSNAYNEFSPYCECLTFVYACTGNPATALLGGTVTITCGSYSDNYTISSTTTTSGAVTLCNTGGIFTCGREETPQLCISEDNWEVCSISGCTVYVDQTLTVEPHINGTLLGYGEYLVPGQSGGLIPCEGRNYTGALNTEEGATDLFFCPGDQLILDLEDFDIPLNSGMCLYVNVYDTDWNPLDGSTFVHSSVTNGTVNVTGAFDDLDTGETYIVSIRLKCCSGNECFDTNASRYAYVNLRGKFGYEPTIVGTSSTVYVPSTTAPGPIISTALGSPPFANAIAFVGNNVVNLSSVDEIDYSLWDVPCSGGTESELTSGTITPDPGNTEIEDVFTTGIIGWSYTTSECKCYRIDLTYYDECSEDVVTDSYFFRSGGDCFAPNDPPSTKLVKGSSSTEFGVSVRVNPIKNATLKLDLAGELPHSAASEAFISIFDASGQVLTSQPLSFDSHEASLPFVAPPGMYFYTVRLGGQTFSGKFVKQ